MKLTFASEFACASILYVFVNFLLCAATSDHDDALPMEPSLKCPPDSELNSTGCLCYPSMSYLICDGSESTLKFRALYSFNSLIIKNSPKLPFWNEYLSASEFKVKSLVILQSTPVQITENFNELLRLPSETIKIIANNQIPGLDFFYLLLNLTSLSLSQIPKVYHNFFYRFNLGDETKLKHLSLRQIGFYPPIKDLFLEGLSLSRVEITFSNLTGSFAFVPTVCPTDNDHLIVDLRGNQLTDFNFAYLFPSFGPNCQYHIDLSENVQLKKDLLISQLPALKEHGEKMFINLSGVKVDCNCELVGLFQEKLASKIHGVVCNKYGRLDVIANDNELIKQICAK